MGKETKKTKVDTKRVSTKAEKKVVKTDYQVWAEKNAEKLKVLKPAEKLEFIFNAGVLRGKALQREAAKKAAKNK